MKWASLYYHFEDKDAILDGVAKLALVQRADISIDQTAPWDEQIVALSVGVYRTLMRHPNLVALLVRRADRAFATGSHRHVAQKLMEGGFPPDLVVPVMDSLEGYLIGMATIDAQAADAVPYGEGIDDAPAIRAALDADALDPAVRYELGVRALLAGWAERAVPAKATATSDGQNTIPDRRHERRSSSSTPSTELSTSSVSCPASGARAGANFWPGAFTGVDVSRSGRPSGRSTS